MSKYEYLFKPININNLEIKNRIVFAPMATGGMLHSDGTYTDRVVEYYRVRASGGCGLVVSGVAKVEKRSVASPLVIYNPDGSIFSHEYVQTDPFLSECSYFVDCIENGSEITKGSLQDDRNALLYSLSAKRSYELNKAVKFGQIWFYTIF